MISLIFLAGGSGSRMGSPLPKQYLPLRGKPIALHSFELFTRIPEIGEIIVVCEEEHQRFFSHPVLFAAAGCRRQDSVYSGLLQCSQEIVFIHDAARPFFDPKTVPLLLRAVQTTGAAALASPAVNTIKQCAPNHIVEKTLERSTLWEMQTPQAIRRDLLLEAYAHAHLHHFVATDDLSLIEAIGLPTQIVPPLPAILKSPPPLILRWPKHFSRTLSAL